MTKREIELRRKIKEMTRWWCKWNRHEADAEDVVNAFGNLFHKETLATWNDPLETPLVEQ